MRRRRSLCQYLLQNAHQGHVNTHTPSTLAAWQYQEPMCVVGSQLLSVTDLCPLLEPLQTTAALTTGMFVCGVMMPGRRETRQKKEEKKRSDGKRSGAVMIISKNMETIEL